VTEKAGQSDAERALAHAEREAAAEAAADRSTEPEPVDDAEHADALSTEPEPALVADALPEPTTPGRDAMGAKAEPALIADPTPQPTTTAEPRGGTDLSADGHSTARAQRIEIREGGAANIEADSVSITQGGATRVNARDVTISMGGAVLVRTDTLRLEDNAAAVAVVARRAQVAPGSRILILISRQTSGDVQPVLDWRAALAAVAGFLVIRRLLGVRRRR
jgi:hypothetical protein